MEIEQTQILIGLGGLAITAIGGWWLKNRGNAVTKIADALEDVVEDLTGKDIELDDVVSDVMDSMEDVVEEASEEVMEALEEGESVSEALEEVADDVVEDVADAVEDLQARLSNLKVAELKQILKSAGLPVSGNKLQLIDRLTKGLDNKHLSEIIKPNWD